MKIKGTVSVILICIMGLMSSCHMNMKKNADLAPNVHQINAEEVLQTNNYTYIRASEDGNEYWMAIERAEIKAGGTYYWKDGGEMKDFYSKELKRSFPTIFFVQTFSEKPITKTKMNLPPSMAGKPKAPEKAGINVPKAQGGVTIAELFTKKEAFNGKQIKISGEVVKFSPEIMKKNWVHIQDGTKAGDNYDLTITTLDVVKVGDIVTFTGTVSVNKNFGAGYVYEVVVEDALLGK